MSRVRRSLALSALDSYLGVVLQIAGTVIMARLLTPAEVGIFAVAAVFSAVASTFRDFGVGEYLIQERNLNNDALRAAFTVNIVISWLMGLLLFAISPAAANYYSNDGVGQVMRIQAFNFVMIPFGAVTMAWFRREMSFKPILVAGLTANSVSFVVAVVLAVGGAGYMSLAWSSLVGVAVTVSVSIWYRPSWFPKLPGVRGIRKVLHFGTFASGIYIFNQAARGAPELVIGRAFDMPSVGMFSRAAALTEIFNRLVVRAVNPICLPYFSSNVRETGSPIHGVLLATTCLSGIGWPFLACMAIAAPTVIHLMYGSQWLEAVPLARLLCAAAAVELLHHTAKDAILSVGKVTQSNTLQFVLMLVRIAALLVGAPFGLQGICVALILAAMINLLVAQHFLRRHIGLLWRDTLSSLVPSVGTTGVAIAPAILFAFAESAGLLGDTLSHVLGLLLAVPAWLAGARLAKHPLWSEAAALMRSLYKRWRRTADHSAAEGKTSE
jgi:O-antigen/teichoic acid export membrane protein